MKQGASYTSYCYSTSLTLDMSDRLQMATNLLPLANLAMVSYLPHTPAVYNW